jgi:alpha-tubulin suppressor-like RCC1 family protein
MTGHVKKLAACIAFACLMAMSANAQLVANLALNKPANQSGYYLDGTADKANDGNTNGIFTNHSCCQTRITHNPFWQVDLGTPCVITKVMVWNRDDAQAPWLTNFTVGVSLDLNTWTTVSNSGRCGRPSTINFSKVVARYVQVQLISDANPLSMAEVQVEGTRNLAYNAYNANPARATQSTGSNANNAIDLNVTNGSQTNSTANPWWKVDLGAAYSVTQIKVWNTQGNFEKLKNFDVMVSLDGNRWLTQSFAGRCGIPSTFYYTSNSLYKTYNVQHNSYEDWSPATSALMVRWVKIQLRGTDNLCIGEVQVLSNTLSQIAAGIGTSFFIPPDGGLIDCGDNYYNQLYQTQGVTSYLYPTVTSLGKRSGTASQDCLHCHGPVSQVAAGMGHSLIAIKNGLNSANWNGTTLMKELWTMGFNADGQCGNGTKTDKTYPPYCYQYSPVVAAKCGAENILAGWYDSYFQNAISSDGGLFWRFGENNFQNLGDGTGNDILSPAPLTSFGPIAGIASGAYHTMLIRASDNKLFACGYDGYGQLCCNNHGDFSTFTIVPNFSNVAAVACGVYHTLFLTSDGSLYSCGCNTYGQLGDNTQVDRSTPYRMATNVQAMGAGSGHTVFLKRDGTLWTCGANYYGQLGDGTLNLLTKVPEQIMTDVQEIAVGGFHNLALKTDGTLWGWGENESGELGRGTITYDNPTPQQIIIPDVH